MADVKAEVEAKLKEFERLFNAKDFQGLEKRYTDDCFFLAIGRPVHRGRNGVSGSFKSLFQERYWDSISIKLDDIQIGSPDVLTGSGTFVIHRTDGGQTDEGKYVLLWRRVEGNLLVHYDIFNLTAK